MCKIIISWGAKYSRELVLSRLDKHCCKYSPSFLQIFKYIHSSQVSRWSSIVPTILPPDRRPKCCCLFFPHFNTKAHRAKKAHKKCIKISAAPSRSTLVSSIWNQNHHQYGISIPIFKIYMLIITVILLILHQDKRVCSCLIWPQFVLPRRTNLFKYSLISVVQGNDHHHHHNSATPSPIPPNVFTVRDDF